MNCPTESDLHAYLNGELSDERRAEIEDHVYICERCAGRLGELCSANGGLFNQPEGLAGVAELGSRSRTGDDELPPKLDGFEIEKRLGRGGQGCVWKAVELQSRCVVAIKVPRLEPERRAGAVEYLRNETRWLANLQDVEGILQFKRLIVDDPFGCALVMPLQPGGSLRDLLLSPDGRLDPEKATRLMIRIAKAVAGAHDRGVIHQDLKPENILIDETGTPVVSDFGLAIFEPLRRHGGRTPKGGTPLYRAPEQVRGEDVDERADVWALGIILCELLTGSHPFPGDTQVEKRPFPTGLRNKMPDKLAHVVLGCVQEDLDSRYRNAHRLAYDLEEFISPAVVQPADAYAADERPFLDEHPIIIGRGWAVQRVERLVRSRAKSGGVVVIRGAPGKGKSALLAKLLRDAFARQEPPPVLFPYSARCGRTNPDVFVRTVYSRLLTAHKLPPAAELTDPETSFTNLCDFVRDDLPERATAEKPQIVLVDALDEASKSATGRAPYQTIPDKLPPGVVFVVSTRRGMSEPLMRRRDAECFDFDEYEDHVHHEKDVREYVNDRLGELHLPPARIKKIVRAVKGNFQVLKHLCIEIRSRPESPAIEGLLKELLQSKNLLLTIYEYYWDRCVRPLKHDDPALYRSAIRIAGVLSLARARMTREMISSILKGIGWGTWARVLRRLVEYLDPWVSEGDNEPCYRIYHETFAEFIRTQVLKAEKRRRIHGRIADYCGRWRHLPKGRGHDYALRFAPTHLAKAAKWDDLYKILKDIEFLQAKAEAGHIVELVGDFDLAANDTRNKWRSARETICFLTRALRRDLPFVAAHPSALFQSLYNRCCWHGGAIKRLMDEWREKQSGRPWARALRPPPETLDGPLVTRLTGHTGTVRDVAFAPDGQQVATASQDGTIRLWNPQSGACLSVLRAADIQPVSLRMCNVANGHEMLVQADGPVDVTAVCFSPHGQLLATGHRDTSVRIWQVDRDAELHCLRGHGDSVQSVAFSPDGKLLASGAWDGTVRIWSVGDGVAVASLAANTRMGNDVAFSPDGCRLAAADLRTVRFWEVESWSETPRVLNCQHPLKSLSFSPDGRHLAAASDENVIVVWNLGGFEKPVLLRDHSHVSVEGISFLSDGQHLVAGGNDRLLKIWNITDGRIVSTLMGHQNSITSVAVAADDKFAVSGSHDGSAIVWDISVAKRHSIAEGDDERLRNVPTALYVQNGNLLATSGDSVVRLWETKTGQAAGELIDDSARDWVPECLASADGGDPLVAAGCSDRHVRVWRLSSNGLSIAPIWQEGFGDSTVECVTLSAEHEWIAAGDRCGTVRVARLDRDGWIDTYDGHSKCVFGVTFSADDKFVASCSEDGTVRVWCIAGPETVAICRPGRCYLQLATFRAGDPDLLLPTHGASFSSVAISSDGKWLAAGTNHGPSDGDCVYLWDLTVFSRGVTKPGHRTRISLPEFPICLTGHAGSVDCLLFSSDGIHLASGSADNTVRVWNLVTRQCVRVVGARVPDESVFDAEAANPWQRQIDGPSTRLHRGEVNLWLPGMPRLVRNPADDRFWAGPASSGPEVLLFSIEG